jgi:hemerythrin superfamily protein
MAGANAHGHAHGRRAEAEEAIDLHAGIFRRLVDEHAQVMALMQHVIASPNEAERGELFDEVRRELLSHARAEQATLYATLREHASTEEMALHGWEEHEEVEELLSELEGLDPSDDEWMGLFVQMTTAVEHHVSEEEGEIFAAAKEVIGTQKAEELERDFTTTKEDELERLE